MALSIVELYISFGHAGAEQVWSPVLVRNIVCLLCIKFRRSDYMGIRIYFISQGWSGEVGRIRHKASLANTHDRDVLFQGRTHRASAAAKSHLELACARRIRHACACVSHARKSLNSMSASPFALWQNFHVWKIRTSCPFCCHPSGSESKRIILVRTALRKRTAAKVGSPTIT